MKTLLLGFLVVGSSALAQPAGSGSQGGSGNLFNSNSGVLPGFRREEPRDFAAEAERQRQRNERYRGGSDQPSTWRLSDGTEVLDIDFDLSDIEESVEVYCRRIHTPTAGPYTDAQTRAYSMCTQTERARRAELVRAQQRAEESAEAQRRAPSDPNSSCRANFNQFTRYSYDVGGTGLRAIRVSGSYNVPSPGATFSIVDDDGFFTTAAVVSRWQSQGLLNGTAETNVNLPRVDVETLKDAAEVGEAYYDYILRTYDRPRAGQTAEAFRTFLEEMNARRDYHRNLKRFATTSLASAQSGAFVRVSLSAARLSAATFLERFRNPANNAQYSDLVRPGELSVLCRPNGQNLVTARVVCSRDFLLNERRDPQFCPQGIVFNQFPPVCDQSAGEDCSSAGAGGTTAPAAPAATR